MVPQGGKGISFMKPWYQSRYYIEDDNTAISYTKGDEKQVQLDHPRRDEEADGWRGNP